MSSSDETPDTSRNGDANTNNKSASSSSTAAAAPSPSSSTSTTPSTRANSALSNPSSRKPRKRAKVSFSAEVISKDDSGDGSKVTVKEEHGIFLGPLLGRMMVSSSDQSDDGGGAEGGTAGTAPSSVASATEPIISFAPDALTSEKVLQSESPSGILKPVDSAQPLGDSSIEYDNLVVQMGLLKCGHRYRAVVPVPDYWKKEKEGEKSTTSEDEQKDNGLSSGSEDYSMDVRIAEDSLDDDLRGEVVQAYDVSEGSSEQKDPLPPHHNVNITLSARRRGPYRGRFVLELTRRQEGNASAADSQSTSETESSQDGGTIESNPKESEPSATTSKTTVPSTPQKCLMSLQVDATIMGKDMGTPKLRNGVVCSGKIVGYDSDEETEWQGFD